jgi:hypothetical protein
MICDPKLFLFEGVCLDQGCPDTDLINSGLMLRSDMIYENDYVNYGCKKVIKEQKGYKVRFAKSGYRSRVPID